MPVSKSRVPEYPRPVSPICGDPIPICNDTTIYYDPESNTSEDEPERAAKRRRIEAQATAYLRGQPLFILTAQLRGPFDDGWQNPWAKKSTLKNTRKGTTSHHSANKVATSAGQAVLASPKRSAIPTPTPTHPPPAKERQSTLKENGLSVLRSLPKDKSIEPASVSERLPQPADCKVVDWLKTNETFSESEYAHRDMPPPSPSEGKGNKRSEKKVHTENPSLERLSTTNIPRYFSNSVIEPFKDVGQSLCSPTHTRADSGVDALQELNKRLRFGQQHAQADRKTPNPSSIDESRAEYAILRAKRNATWPTINLTDSHPALGRTGAIHRTTSAGEQAQHDLKRRSDVIHVKAVVENHTMTHSEPNDASASLHTAREGTLTTHEQHETPSPANETTKSNPSTELPSAQLPQFGLLPSLTSNLSSHQEMLQDPPQRDTLMASGNLDAVEVPELPINGIEEHGVHTSVELVPILASIPQAPQFPQEKGTSEGHAMNSTDETAHDMAVTLSTDAAIAVAKALKTSTTVGTKRTSPIGIKKVGAMKNKKRQAITFEEKAAGSIKSSLKVAKSFGRDLEKTLDSKISARYDGDRHLDENNHQHLEPSDGGSPKLSAGPAAPPKSILKSSYQHSQGNTGSSSTKQDAQRQQKLSLAEDEDDFDLDGAIDDLGSYLDTWDAEKQAAGVS